MVSKMQNWAVNVLVLAASLFAHGSMPSGLAYRILEGSFCDPYNVTLEDSNGDGWNGNTLYIGSTTLTLEQGSFERATVCLEPGTYSPHACGGTYPEEVSWTVGGLSGGADNACVGTSGNFTVGGPTLAPSISQSPTTTFVPTPTPTVSSVVYSEHRLFSTIASNKSFVTFGADIYLVNTVQIIERTLSLDGAGWTLNGQSRVVCVYIEDARVTLTNLTIANGNDVDLTFYGGGLSIVGSSNVALNWILVSNNTASRGVPPPHPISAL